MLRIMKTELWKLKRYHILWAGVILMALSLLLAFFLSTADDGFNWTFPFLVEQVIKNNATTIFPMCITLTAGYMAAREEKDDTLKNILTIPVPYRTLLCGKLAVCGLVSVFWGLACAALTVAGGLASGFPGFSVTEAVWAAGQMSLNCLWLYVAVLPIITVFAFMPGGNMIGVIIAFVYGYGGMFAAGNLTLSNIYPITSSLGMIAYRSYEVAWNYPLCFISMASMLLLTAVIIKFMKTDADRKKLLKAEPKAPLKKGRVSKSIKK